MLYGKGTIRFFNVRERGSTSQLCCVQFILLSKSIVVSLTRPLLSFQLSDDDAACDTPLAQLLAERQNERVPRKNTTKTGSTAAGAMGKKGDRSEQVRHVDGKTVFIINVLRYQLRALADPEFRGTKLMVGSPRH